MRKKDLVSKDRVRVVEVGKRQTHLRTKAVRSTKELENFGILLAGKKKYPFVKSKY